MHASPGREVQSDLLSVTLMGAELPGPQAQDAGGEDLGDLGEAASRGGGRHVRSAIGRHRSSGKFALQDRYRPQA